MFALPAKSCEGYSITVKIIWRKKTEGDTKSEKYVFRDFPRGELVPDLPPWKQRKHATCRD
jgi:hypothetical protein